MIKLFLHQLFLELVLSVEKSHCVFFIPFLESSFCLCYSSQTKRHTDFLKSVAGIVWKPTSSYPFSAWNHPLCLWVLGFLCGPDGHFVHGWSHCHIPCICRAKTKSPISHIPEVHSEVKVLLHSVMCASFKHKILWVQVNSLSKITFLSWWDGSAGIITCHHAWIYEGNPQGPHGRRRKHIPLSCYLTCTQAPWLTVPTTYVHSQHKWFFLSQVLTI